jgi:hypothetical protein
MTTASGPSLLAQGTSDRKSHCPHPTARPCRAEVDVGSKTIYQRQMMRLSLGTMVITGLLGVVTTGCASSPAAPFNTMEKANVLVFRLQNYEPPAAVAAAPAAAANPGQALIAGLPPEIQTWVQQGAAGLQQLIPPGLIPGLGQAGQQAATPAPVADVPRFYGFRILGQNQVMDSDLRGKLGKIFGDADNYEVAKSNCLYPELGVAFGPTQGAPTYDYLVSFSCHQVQSKNFQWPHPQTGMKVSMEKDLADVVRKLWPS